MTCSLMKLFHAADLHLDSPMRGLVAYEEAPIEELRLATRVASECGTMGQFDHCVCDGFLLGSRSIDGVGKRAYYLSQIGEYCVPGSLEQELCGTGIPLHQDTGSSEDIAAGCPDWSERR